MRLSHPILSAVLGTLLAVGAFGPVYAEDEAIPAQQEPRHRPKLENEYVRVLDVEIPAGYQTLFHTHALNYTYLMVNAALLRNEVPGKPAGATWTDEPKVVDHVTGATRDEPKPVEHVTGPSDLGDQFGDRPPKILSYINKFSDLDLYAGGAYLRLATRRCNAPQYRFVYE